MLYILTWHIAMAPGLARLGIAAPSRRTLALSCGNARLEMWLRTGAGQPTYSGSFVGHWLQRLLYYEAPAWVFTVAYSVFGLLVLATWWLFPPRNRSPGPDPSAPHGA